MATLDGANHFFYFILNCVTFMKRKYKLHFHPIASFIIFKTKGSFNSFIYKLCLIKDNKFLIEFRILYLTRKCPWLPNSFINTNDPTIEFSRYLTTTSIYNLLLRKRSNCLCSQMKRIELIIESRIRVGREILQWFYMETIST